MRVSCAILLAVWSAAGAARAETPRIALVLAEADSSLRAPLLLSLRLEFPDASIAVVDPGHAATRAGVAASIWVSRTSSGLRVRVEELGAHVAVEREIPSDGSGDEAVAHAVALLARSLLGVALLYEPERAARSPTLGRIAHRTSTHALRVLRRGGLAEPDPPLLLGAAVAATSPLASIRSARIGGRLGVAWKLAATNLEMAAEVAFLSAVDGEREGDFRITHRGTPVGLWLRWRLLHGVFEIAPGIGASVERSAVTATVEPEGLSHEYTDWNVAVGIEARARYRVIGSLHAEVGLRGTAGESGQEYRFEAERILVVGGPSWAADLGLVAAVP